jgi:hypothetical protein
VSGLDQRQAETVILGSCLLDSYGDALSDHERETVEEASRRFRRHGVDMTLTAEEWRVIDGAVGALDVARKEAVAEFGRRAGEPA